MKIKALIWILFGSCCITSAFASHDYEIDHEIDKPYYAGLGFGFSSSDSECDYYGWDCDGEGTSFTFMAGKRLHENFAIELAYLDLGNLDDEQSAGITTTAESTGFNLSVLGIIPLEHHGYFFAKVGAMAWDTDYTRRDGNTRTSSDDSGTDATFGVGFAALFQNKTELRIEYERLNELDDRFTPGGDHITQLTFNVVFYIK